MADLRIVDAPLLSTVKGTEKIPTGGEGNFSISVDQVADFSKLKWLLATEGYVDNAVGNVQADLNLHKNNSSNPHQVTKAQVGLGNVDNTADLDKPVSNATQSAIITANSGKADKSYVDSQDQLKADKITVEASLLLKADKADLTASKITSDSNQTQQAINDFGGAKWYNKAGGYNLGATVKLANGDIVKSTVPNNTINPNVDMTGWEIATRDKGVLTWSSLTQETKNKENPSPADYGAKGDGVTNDNTAFTSLEVAYTNYTIDLLGKTYKITKPFVKNEYVNGYFLVGSSRVPAKADLRKTTSSPPLISNSNANLFYKRYSLVRGSGTGGINSVPQGVAYDAVNEVLYETSGGGTDGRGHSLNVFPAPTIGKLTTYYANRSILFGHQGVGVSYDPTTKKPIVWLSRNYNDNASTGHQVTAFNNVRFTSDENSITDNMYVFDVLESSTSAQSTTPCVSPCGRFLVIKKTGTTSARLRILDAQRMWADRATKTDYSNDFIFEFNYDRPASTALQGLACDGTYIYSLEAQAGFVTNAWVYVFTMAGDLVDKVNISVVGEDDAIADSPNPASKNGTKEYEGLLIFQDAGKLSLGINLATTYNKVAGQENCYVYEIGAKSGTVHKKDAILTTNARLNSGSANLESYNFGCKGVSASDDYFWTVNPTRKGFLTNNGNPIYWAGTLTGGIQAVSNGSEGMSNIILARTDDGVEGSRLIFHKSRSASVNSEVNVSMGTARMGTIYFGGDTGSGSAEGATIVSGGTVSDVNIDAYVEVGVQNGLGAKQNYRFDKTAFTANGDNNKTLGKAESRWSTIYAGTGTINTSDERLKQQFRSQTDREKAAALEIKNSICLFKFNDAVDLKGDCARWHVGVKAQQVISILESHDLDPFEYAFVCFDEWVATEEIIEDGETIQEYRAAGSLYAVRYDELAMFILAAI